MKILLITGSFYPDVGGVQNVVYNIAKELKDEDITVVTSTKANPYKLNLESEKFENFHISRIWMNLPRSFFGYVVFPIKFIISILKLLILVKKNNPDVINYHFPDDSSIYLFILSKVYNKIPIITNIHGNDLHIYYQSRKHKYFINNTLHRSKYIIVNSAYMKDELLKTYKADNKKIKIIPNGINLKKFRSRRDIHVEENNVPYVFFIGRMVKKKGVDVLIKAWGISNFKNTKLILEGGGEFSESAKTLVKDLRLQDSIKFTNGSLDKEEKISYMKGAIFCVIPSRIEPFGIVALEYLASDAPVIASNTGGLKDILIDNKNCLFFNNGDYKDLSDKMRLLYNDPGLRNSLVEEGRETIQKYDNIIIAQKYLDCFKEVANN